MKHDKKGLVKDWKNGEDIHRFDWDLSLLSKDLYKIRDFKEHMMKLMLMNGWIATYFKAEQDRVGSWEERYWQCVTIDWNCIEFYNLLELGREESGREDAGQWIVASLWRIKFLAQNETRVISRHKIVALFVIDNWFINQSLQNWWSLGGEE